MSFDVSANMDSDNLIALLLQSLSNFNKADNSAPEGSKLCSGCLQSKSVIFGGNCYLTATDKIYNASAISSLKFGTSVRARFTSVNIWQ